MDALAGQETRHDAAGPEHSHRYPRCSACPMACQARPWPPAASPLLCGVRGGKGGDAVAGEDCALPDGRASARTGSFMKGFGVFREGFWCYGGFIA